MLYSERFSKWSMAPQTATCWNAGASARQSISFCGCFHWGAGVSMSMQGPPSPIPAPVEVKPIQSHKTETFKSASRHEGQHSNELRNGTWVQETDPDWVTSPSVMINRRRDGRNVEQPTSSTGTHGGHQQTGAGLLSSNTLQVVIFDP